MQGQSTRDPGEMSTLLMKDENGAALRTPPTCQLCSVTLLLGALTSKGLRGSIATGIKGGVGEGRPRGK